MMADSTSFDVGLGDFEGWIFAAFFDTVTFVFRAVDADFEDLEFETEPEDLDAETDDDLPFGCAFLITIFIIICF